MSQPESDLTQPFFYRRGSRGVLLIHGFTGTPYIFRELGAQLADQGFTVSAPLLAGHGTTMSDLEQTTWEDWYHSVETAYLQLRESCETVAVIGASFGSNLALHLASKYPVQSLVLIGTPRWLNLHWLMMAILQASPRLGVRYFPKPPRRSGARNARLNDTVFSYPRLPVRSVQEMFDCINESTCRVLPQIAVPALIIQSRRDGVIHPASARFLHRRLGSQKKQLLWIDEPHHTIHISQSRGSLFQIISHFLCDPLQTPESSSLSERFA